MGNTPWYKKWWGIALIVLFLWPFFLPWYAWAKSNWSKGIKIAVTVSTVIFLLIIRSATTASPTTQQSNQQSNQSSQSAATKAPEEKPLDYEIMGEDKNGTLNRVTVITQEKDDARLIKLNDQLLERYKPGITNLFIDYFDDKTVANGYFKKVLDPNLSEAEADRLYSHYIANMNYNTNTGYKKFVRQGNDQRVLKSY